MKWVYIILNHKTGEVFLSREENENSYLGLLSENEAKYWGEWKANQLRYKFLG